MSAASSHFVDGARRILRIDAGNRILQEDAIGLRAATSSRTPVRMPTTEVRLGNRHVPTADAHQLTAALGATQRPRLLLSVHHFTDDLPRRTRSGAASDGVCGAILWRRRARVSCTCGAALI
jgi:hypothetical protein